ncbi:uncharacterized protein SCHCODRAFT_02126946 [Schizophyllum commune H4-8]|nr:uncharacterized protein SCHCODRAFT_02126946 [Schizophyllum commune H4-8]KAI5885384.1 hypothetical protein SCHCODRAFT_02126946 [Schizophyllum commune H4-8]
MASLGPTASDRFVAPSTCPTPELPDLDLVFLDPRLSSNPDESTSSSIAGSSNQTNDAAVPPANDATPPTQRYDSSGSSPPTLSPTPVKISETEGRRCSFLNRYDDLNGVFVRFGPSRDENISLLELVEQVFHELEDGPAIPSRFNVALPAPRRGLAGEYAFVAPADQSVFAAPTDTTLPTAEQVLFEDDWKGTLAFVNYHPPDMNIFQGRLLHVTVGTDVDEKPLTPKGRHFQLYGSVPLDAALRNLQELDYYRLTQLELVINESRVRGGLHPDEDSLSVILEALAPHLWRLVFVRITFKDDHTASHGEARVTAASTSAGRTRIRGLKKEFGLLYQLELHGQTTVSRVLQFPLHRVSYLVLAMPVSSQDLMDIVEASSWAGGRLQCLYLANFVAGPMRKPRRFTLPAILDLTTVDAMHPGLTQLIYEIPEDVEVRLTAIGPSPCSEAVEVLFASRPTWFLRHVNAS